MNLVMTEKEILREYTEALDPQGQIKILADLNLTDKGTIRRVLQRNGIDLPEEPKRIKKEWKPPVVCVNAEDIPDKSKIMEIIHRQGYKSVLDCEKAVDLYLQGKCDREIGAAFITTKQNVRYWRKSRGLPTLLKSKKQNADKSVRAKKRDVVYCAECKHWWKTAELCTNKNCCHGDVACVKAPATHYCGYGEPKDEN